MIKMCNQIFVSNSLYRWYNFFGVCKIDSSYTNWPFLLLVLQVGRVNVFRMFVDIFRIDRQLKDEREPVEDKERGCNLIGKHKEEEVKTLKEICIEEVLSIKY